MDVKLLVDSLAENARPIAMALAALVAVSLFLRSAFMTRVKKVATEMFFENWQLGLLGTAALVLSVASGWRTWEGMTNFTNEPLASGLITFGLQAVMLIVAWLIGESFATGMNVRARTGASDERTLALQTWLGPVIGVTLFILGFVLLLQWTGQGDIRQAGLEDLAWSATGDKMLILGAGLLLVALFALYAASDVVQPYLQGARVIVRNSMLWVMFLACMATSVFFSFDSFFTSIFPQSERVRAAELRAQNQVAGIVADIDQTIAARRVSEAESLFKTEAWDAYERQLDGVAGAAAAAEGAIERYVNNQIEQRRSAVREQQERMASAQSGQAGLATRKTSLTEEKGRLVGERPALAAEFAEKKADVSAKQKDADAKRVEALAEDKGVEGTGKQGRGPMYRERMAEFSFLQGAVKVAEERMRDAQRRLSTVETRLSQIDRELALIDGDLAKLKGEADTAEQRIAIAEKTVEVDGAPTIDPARLLPAFQQSVSEFRVEPTPEKLANVQRLCGDITGALSATPDTKASIAAFDCDPKSTADAAVPLFTLQAGAKTFSDACIGGKKLNAQNSADALFAFARRCLADSGLPSKDTDQLRAKINLIELSRDDKAHRFVVTWNAFEDGNRLAYLALAIAIGLDGLIFLSGLFGANAVRSPLSDVPTNKSRSAAQLEATINAALGPHPYETAWMTLNALRPMTNSDGFSAWADLSAMERSAADRVRMVLTAGADIGAVETIGANSDRYRVRSELREYLSSVCDRHFKSNADAKDRARLDQLVSAALAPYPREHADVVLHELEPIRETEGFTSMVTLSAIADAYDNRVVRRVMNAGAAVKAVAPDRQIDDRYYVSPALYETLLIIRATAPESANYAYDRRRFGEAQDRPAIDAGALHEAHPELPLHAGPPKLERPQPALSRLPELSAEETAKLAAHYREELLGAISLTPAVVNQRLNSEAARTAMREAWRSLVSHGRKNELLGTLLRAFQEDQQRRLGVANSNLRSGADGDPRKVTVLGAVNDQLDEDLALFMLFPEMHLIDYLIEEIESAAQSEDGLQPGEQALRDQLKYAREGLGQFNLANPRSWDEIRQRLANGYRRNVPGYSNKPHRGDNGIGDSEV
ncbi:MAG: hypothetical protein ACT4OU_00625 [Hyphomicrobium sp.]